jgi:Fic family protein
MTTTLRGEGWPSLGWEEQTWVPSTVWGADAERGARGARYRSAVPAAIAHLTPVPSAAAGSAAEVAARELSRLDAELGGRVAAFAPVLLRSEAASSSQIENITASARAIFSAELGAKGSRNAEIITANTRAMTAAIELADDVTPDAILRMHEVLMVGQSRHTPGRWRDEAVWIGTRSDSPVGAEYVAPHHSRIPPLIEDLTAFARRRDVAPLVAVAIAHAQFETIHPFTDGNGRTGRALAQSLLRFRGVTLNVAVPVSAGLLADVEGYHRALTAYREGDLSPIVSAFADAAMRAVGNTRELIAELDGIREEWNGRLTVRRSSNAWRLLDVLLRRPVLTSAAAAAELGVRQPNVYPPLTVLVDAGILKSKAEHRLGPFWRSDEVLDAIDHFAQRAGRREAR